MIVVGILVYLVGYLVIAALFGAFFVAPEMIATPLHGEPDLEGYLVTGLVSLLWPVVLGLVIPLIGMGWVASWGMARIEAWLERNEV